MRTTSQSLSSLWKAEDWWAVWIGSAVLASAVVLAAFGTGIKTPKIERWGTNPGDAFYSEVTVGVSDWPATFPFGDALELAAGETVAARFRVARKVRYQNGVRNVSETIGWKSRYVMRAADRESIQGLVTSPAHRDAVDELFRRAQSPKPNVLALATLMLVGGTVFALAIRLMGGPALKFVSGYVVVFLLAIVAYLIAGQDAVRAYGLPYALWALAFGLLISNTVGTPKWLLAGARTELYIKTGLVLLGAEVLLGKIAVLGSRGLIVAWLVTPCVILFMYFFGTRVLKMPSKALVIVVAAATSVCGVSAAIATAAAAKAKKEELTLAVGMTLIFTVLMMIGMPPLIKAVGMDAQVGGAWMGGTIDATGAVVAAGALLGDSAEIIAAVVKMVQNILIGLVAFCVAVAWATKIENDGVAARPSVMEIWHRFPKFIVGFVAASVVFSCVIIPAFGGGPEGLRVVEKDVIGAITKTARGWLFCMAFVAIGLESNFRQLSHQMTGGKPIVLYVVGQSFNLILTLIAAQLVFGGWLFDQLPLD